MPSRFTKDLPADFLIEVRKGDVPGHIAVSQLGHTDAMDTNLRYLHHEHNTGDLDLTTLYDTPATVKISSTDVDDDGSPAGNGAQTILLEGYDASGDPLSETVTLDGQTEVVSSGTYKFIERATVTAVGSTGSNEGVIWVGAGTVTSGVPATKYLSMEVGTNISRNGSLYVRNGYSLYIVQTLINISDTAKSVNVQYTLYTGSNIEIFDLHFAGSSVLEVPVHTFGAIAGNTLLGVKVAVTVAGGTITTLLDGVLVAD